MTVEIVCASRELFGSDRSAVRLAVLLAGLGLEARLVVPRARPERGLTRLAAASGIAVEPAAVLVASSRGLDDVRALASRPAAPATGATLTIYNSAAVVARPGDSSRRLLVLREWLRPRSLGHRALAGLHGRRMRGVVAVSSAVGERWRACAGERIAVCVCNNWLEDSWLEPGEPREREGIMFAGRFNAWKGQELLADAYERAFAGPGARPSLTFLGAERPPSPFSAAAERLRARCEPAGWRLLELTQAPREPLGRAALVVAPSLRPEPFGNVILEALATGARVIAFPGGGVDDLAPHFRGVLEVVDRGLDPLARALRRWWAAGGTAQDRDQRSRVLATLGERFSAAAAAPRWERLLERLAGGAGSPGRAPIAGR